MYACFFHPKLTSERHFTGSCARCNVLMQTSYYRLWNVPKAKKILKRPWRFYISIGKSVKGFLLRRFNLFSRIQEINAKDGCNFFLTRSDKTRDDKYNSLRTQRRYFRSSLLSRGGEKSYDRKYVCVRRLGTVSNKVFCIFCFPFFTFFLLTDVS